jgi:hypothetical protein
MDQHVPRAITVGLRLRGVDVYTAHEDGAAAWGDSALLERAGELGRLLFTRDMDFLIEGRRRQRAGVPFAGIVYAHQLEVSIAACICDLELIATLAEPEEVADQVIFLPL